MPASENFGDFERHPLAWLEGLLYDLRFSFRGLRRDRMFTLTAVAMLTLAIALNATVFAIMDTMLFRGFPLVQRNNRVMILGERYSATGRGGLSYPDFESWRAQAHSFSGFAYVGERGISLRAGEGRATDLLAFIVSANTFGLLGVRPILGRDFEPADEAPGAPPVVILNYRFWKSRFAQRADIAGLRVHIDGAPATIIGVMPERFDFPTKENLWMPVTRSPDLLRRGVTQTSFIAVGRLRDGVSLRQARAELETINRRLEADYPATNRGLIPTMLTPAQLNSGTDAPVIWGSLFAAACFVFLIACANLANLTLARAMERWREFSTRIALGASQGRMMRQILAEGLVLAVVAGALGWWIVNWSVRAWDHATESQYQVLDFTVDSRTFLYLVAITLAAAIFCSLAPAARVVQLGVNGVLKGDARGVTQSLRGKHLSAILVAVQMGLAVVLLSGAGVLVRSYEAIVGAKTGVRDPEHVLAGLVRLPSDKYPTPAARLAYLDRLETQLRAVPGIESECMANTFPTRGLNRRAFEIDGRLSAPSGGDAVGFMTVSPDYFRVMGASAIAGRDFNAQDGLESPVAIVNQSFADKYWPSEQPIGKRLRVVGGSTPGAWHLVVGVAPNILQGDATRQKFSPLVYVPVHEVAPGAAYFFVRTSVPPDRVAQAVRADVQELDPDVPLQEFSTLKARFGFDRDYMDLEHSELGKNATVAPIFAAIALLLAAIGLYAVIARSVRQRTKEIGLRMAIGAAAADIRRMILGDGILPVAIGLVLGLAVSAAVNRVLQSQLIGVSPYDSATMTLAPVILIAVALVACLIPARRAMLVDPAVALRHD